VTGGLWKKKGQNVDSGGAVRRFNERAGAVQKEKWECESCDGEGDEGVGGGCSAESEGLAAMGKFNWTDDIDRLGAARSSVSTVHRILFEL
jgi:hypothetical protein